MERTKEIVTMEWIKVEDQMPQSGQIVQIFQPRTGERLTDDEIQFQAENPGATLDGVGVAFYSDRLGFFLPGLEGGNANEFIGVTHWKPVSKPPTK